MILSHSPAPGLEHLPIVPPVLGEYDRGMKTFPAVKPGGRRNLAGKVNLKMGEYKFYAPDGKELKDSCGVTAKEKFVALYNQIYYYDAKTIPLEQRMENILTRPEGAPLSEDEIGYILSWKIPAAYDSKTKIITPVRTKEKTISAKEVYSKLPEGGAVRLATDDDLERITDIVYDLLSVDNINLVYAITIVYFVSHGYWPIYDRFAHITIEKLLEKGSFNSIITDSKLSKSMTSYIYKKNYIGSDEKMRNAIRRALTQYNANYVKPIRDIFPEYDYHNRDLDRALWTYGHLFSDNSTNRENMR